MKSLNVKPLLDEWGWQAQAACRGMDASVFFSPVYERGDARRRREERAKTVCGGCPVRVRCAAFAAATGQAFGVWGGQTEAERGHTRHPPEAARRYP